jgi:hypothetical protein
MDLTSESWEQQVTIIDFVPPGLADRWICLQRRNQEIDGYVVLSKGAAANR